MKKIGPYLIFFAAMLWATDAPFRAYLTYNLSSNFIVLVEHFFDVLILLPIVFLNFKEFRKLKVRQWLAVICIAVGGSALASIAFTQAFHYVNPSVVILLQKLQPLIAIALAVSILQEKTKKYFWFCALLALTGAYLISFPGLRPEIFPGDRFNPNVIGIALALGAAVLWGASTVLGKYVLSSVDFKVMTTLRFSLAFIFILLVNIWQKSIPPLSTVSGRDWLYLFIIAIASGAVSLSLYYKGLSYTKASIATLAELGFPMAAVLINWYFLNQGLAIVQIGGMVILLGSVLMLAQQNMEEDSGMLTTANNEYGKNPTYN